MHAALVLLLTLAAPVFAEVAVFRNCNLIDGTGKAAVPGMSLVVTNGKIVTIGAVSKVKTPAGAEVVDLSGKYVMPGIINLHGHVGLPATVAQQQLRTYATYGVTTVVSLGTDLDEMFAVRAGQHEGKNTGRPEVARLYTAGRGFILKTGNAAPPPNAPRFMIDSVAEVKPKVDELAAKKADFVKMWVDDNFGRGRKLSPEVTSAIISEAHKHGIRAVAHIVSLADAKQLIGAGLDGLAHSIRDQEVDAELIAMMKKQGAWQMAPTLTRELSAYIYAERPKFLDEPFLTRGVPAADIELVKRPEFVNRMKNDPDFERNRGLIEMAKRNLKKLFDAGVKIGFGTDTGPTGRFQGYFEHVELELMVEAGLTPMQAIVAATKSGAEFLKASDLGTLEKGKWADLLVMSKNPLDDIRNTRSLTGVYIAGREVSKPAQSGLAAKSGGPTNRSGSTNRGGPTSDGPTDGDGPAPRDRR